MTLLYQHPQFLEHDTGDHPESAERLRAIGRHLATTGLDQKCVRPEWQKASPERLARVHDPAYLAALARFIERGGGRVEEDTVTSSGSLAAAELAAGAACDAVERVVRGDDTTALCLVRPPGHHALPAGPMGFCLLNNVAVAARMAVEELVLERVLVVDWDVHHGNGTQDTFWRDGRAGFFSIHRYPFYPGSGSREETGSGPGLGMVANVPVALGTSRRAYFDQFRSALDHLASKVRPQLILVSAGFDAHRDDPIGSLGLEVEDFRELTGFVRELARSHCGGKLVSVLEGGYNIEVLPHCVAAHLEALLT